MTDQHKKIYALFQNKNLTERQANILAAATELFAEKGFAATSTSEIARKAGVAEGTIFRHYRTKKELLLVLTEPVMAEVIGPFVMKEFNKVLDKDFERLEDFLRAVIENRREFLLDNMPLIQILVQEVPFHPELKAQFKEQVAKRVFRRLHKVVCHYQEKGQIKEMPAQTVIRLIGSALFGYFAVRYGIAPEADWDDDAEIERTIGFIIQGLSPASD
jgi:AcrR family transcriptional regulator